MRAYAYLRVSGKGQVDGDGFPRQLAAIEEYAAANSIKVEKVWREEGVSGTLAGEDRPAWSQMVAEAQVKDVPMIIVERLDRLARDLMVQETALRDLTTQGVTLVSVYEPDLSSNDPTRVMVRQIMGAVAQYDKSNLVAKLRSARMRTKQKEGRCEGAKPYGEFPGEMEVVEKMSQLLDRGLGPSAIALSLNEDGVRPRTAAKWSPYSVTNILDRLGLRPRRDRRGKPRQEES